MISLFSLLFGGVVAADLYLLRAVQGSIPSESGRSTGREARVFHFGAVLPSDSREPYFTEARKAILAAASEGNAAIQFFDYPGSAAISDIAMRLGMAAELDLDGVIVSVPDDPALTRAVDAIVAVGVPVVTLEADLPGSKRKVFVGSNEFQLGTLAGTAASRSAALAGRQGSKVAVVFSQRYAGRDANRNSFLMGFQSALAKTGTASLGFVGSTGPDALSGEEVLREVLDMRPDIGVMVFTSARDTAEAARAVIEFNRVGRLSLVGFDDDPTIVEHIKNGVVAATVARDPGKAGREALLSLVRLRKGGVASAFVDTGADIRDETSAGRKR